MRRRVQGPMSNVQCQPAPAKACRFPILAASLLSVALPQCALAYSKTQAVARARIPEVRPPMELMPPTFWELHGGVVVTGAIMALAALALVVWLLRRARPGVVTPADVTARLALVALLGRAEDEPTVAAVSQYLRRYISAAFLASDDALTVDETLTALKRLSQVPADLSAALAALLRECEAREFAPISPPAPPALVARALELVARFESLRPPPPVAAR